MDKQIILCVDDEIAVLDNLREQLKKNFGAHFYYEFVQSAEEAWDVIAELQADGDRIVMVIVDWLMPATQGDTFLIDLHQQHPEIIKVMLTGLAKDDAVIRAQRQANLFRRLNKPWEENDLIAVVNDALRPAAKAG